MATLNLQVAATADDGYWLESGSLGTGIAPVGDWYGTPINVFARFDGIELEQGASILHAYFIVRAQQYDAGAFASDICAIDADDAAAPTTYSAAENATRTTASVAWDTSTAWSEDGEYTSPDIASVIQEIVDRDNWASTNAICLLWEDGGSSDVMRRIYDYSESTTYAAKLQIVTQRDPSTFYVDAADGSDAADGATGTPWKTITYALTQLIAGDTLLLRGSDAAADYYREIGWDADLQDLTIGADTGNAPVIVGTHAYTSWSKTDGHTNVYEADVSGASATYAGAVWNGTQRLVAAASVAAVDAATNSSYIDTGTLYVNIGGSAPTSIEVYDQTRAASATLSATGITVQDVTFRYHYGALTMSAANCTLDTVTFQHWYSSSAASGFGAVELNASGLTVQDCTIVGDPSGSELAVETGVVLGIATSTNASAADIDGCTISYCVQGVYLAHGTGHTIQDSTIHHCYNGFYTTSTVSVTVTGNTIYDTSHGVAEFRGTGAHSVTHNVAYYTTDPYHSGEHGWIFHNSGSHGFYHNIVAWFNRDTGGYGEGVWLAPISGTLTFTAKNNAFYNCIDALHYDLGTVVYDLDYSGFYGCTNNYDAIDAGDQGTHDVTGAPSYVDASTYDFHLQSGSPYINAGVAVAGINDGYSGTAPDIGRYETVAYTLTADAAGSYALTGKDPTLAASRKLALDAGAYTLAGKDAGVLRGYPLAADAGNYTLAGKDPALIAARALAADAGAYTLAGKDAALTIARLLTADAAGAYTLTGRDATLTYATAGAYTLTADNAGAYALTGHAAGLIAARVLAPDTGVHTLTGADAALVRGFLLALDAGAYTTSGADPTLTAALRLDAGAGAYTTTGQDAALTIARALAAEAGSYVVTGADAGLVLARVLGLDAGAYTVAGKDATLTADVLTDYTLTADAAGAYALTGLPVTIIYSGLVTPDDRIYVVAAEGRVYIVAAESRTHTVAAEGRVYTAA